MSNFIVVNDQLINLDHVATVTSQPIVASTFRRFIFTDAHGKVIATNECKDVYEDQIVAKLLPAPAGFMALEGHGDYFNATPIIAFRIRLDTCELFAIGANGACDYNVIQWPDDQIWDGMGVFKNRAAYVEFLRATAEEDLRRQKTEIK